MCSEMRTRQDQEAVSPVVGTLLVLAITVVGMAGIMLWGAPTIEAVQAQNAQVAIIGEFEELRASSIELSIPDASRIPTVNVPRGELSIEQGTRMMVIADRDVDFPTCDLQVTGWTGTSPDTQVTVSASNCRAVGTTCAVPATQACIEVLEVVGSNTVRRAVTSYAGGTLTVASADFSQGDWLIRLTDGDTLNPDVHAEAWLFDSDAVTWRLATSNGGVAAYYDLGAVFSANAGANFVEKGPSLQEDEFASGVFALRLRTMSDTSSISGISGRGSHEIFLGLVGNHARIDADDVHRIRFTIAGDLAESWCNLLVQRNELGASTYTEDATLPCDQATASALRSVTYVPATVPFPAEVLHAEIRVTLAV